MYSSAVEIFVYYVFPMMVLTVGLFGNIAGLLVLRGEKLDKIGPLMMYRALYTSDLISLLGINVSLLVKGFKFNLFLISELSYLFY